MHMPVLPAGLFMRPATSDDARAIAALSAARELLANGKASTTAAEIVEFWQSRKTNLSKHSCLILHEDGRLLGYTAVSPDLREQFIDLDPFSEYDRQFSIVQELLQAFVEEHAQELLSEFPHLKREIHALGFEDARTNFLQEHGFTLKAIDLQLGIILTEEPVPQPLEGITIRHADIHNEADARAMHRVIAETFPEIDGEQRGPYEEWLPLILGRASYDPSMGYIALEGDEVIGVIHCRTYEQEGMIWQFAVRRPWRRRGVGEQLMKTVLAAYYRRGITDVILIFNTINPTGAREFYAQAGFQQRERMDDLVKAI